MKKKKTEKPLPDPVARKIEKTERMFANVQEEIIAELGGKRTLQEEYELIQRKQCRLSAKARDYVVYVVTQVKRNYI